MSTARQQAMLDIQAQINATQYAQTKTGVTQATAYTPSNNPYNATNPYETIAPPPPPGSAEPTIPNDLDITAEDNRVIDPYAVYGKVSGFFGRIGRGARARGYRVNRWLGGIPTPGSIWVPFWILMFLWLVLLPVNGHTRIRWLWNTFFGFSALSHVEGTTNQPITKNSEIINTTTPNGGGVVNTQPVPTQAIIWQQPGTTYLYLSNLGGEGL